MCPVWGGQKRPFCAPLSCFSRHPSANYCKGFYLLTHPAAGHVFLARNGARPGRRCIIKNREQDVISYLSTP